MNYNKTNSTFLKGLANKLNRTSLSKSHTISTVGDKKGEKRGNTTPTENSVHSHLSSEEEVEIVALNTTKGSQTLPRN